MTLDQWIQMSVAIGTLAVAVTAIWGQRIAHAIGLGPSLRLELVDALGELIISRSGDGSSSELRYYHVRVSNAHRWAQATNVRVVITAISKPSADGTLARQALVGPLQLMWRFSNFHPQYSIVGPDDIADIGHVTPGLGFTLTPFVFPNNFTGSLHPHEQMRVELRAVADNGESQALCLDISWDGAWSTDTLTMATHLVVKTPACT